MVSKWGPARFELASSGSVGRRVYRCATSPVILIELERRGSACVSTTWLGIGGLLGSNRLVGVVSEWGPARVELVPSGSADRCNRCAAAPVIVIVIVIELER